MRLRPTVSALLVAVETNNTDALNFLLEVNPSLALSVTTAAISLARHPRSQVCPIYSIQFWTLICALI